MAEADWLSERFDAERGRLIGLAYRMLGSRDDAEDAVQEAWVRLTEAGHSAVENLGGWLTTVVSRVCLDQLRARRVRDHQPLEAEHLDREGEASPRADPEHEVLLAESVGMAMLVVLDALEPAERVSFVLHDMFAVPFEEIGTILERSPVAARQLASRARRRVQGADVPSGSASRQHELVSAFLAASREGNFQALLQLLDSDVVLRADAVAVELSASRRSRGAPELATEMRGAAAVARTFRGQAAGARAALIDREAGAVWPANDRPRAVFRFETDQARITAIEVIASPETISEFDVVLLPS